MPKENSEVESRQLTHREIKEWREKLLKKQKGVCPLCGELIATGEAALDHCYDTGHIRAVLHTSCNGAEGQVKRWAGRRSRGNDHILFVKNLLKYWKKDYSKLPLHPTFGKPIRRKRRRRKNVK